MLGELGSNPTPEKLVQNVSFSLMREVVCKEVRSFFVSLVQKSVSIQKLKKLYFI